MSFEGIVATRASSFCRVSSVDCRLSSVEGEGEDEGEARVRQFLSELGQSQALRCPQLLEKLPHAVRCGITHLDIIQEASRVALEKAHQFSGTTQEVFLAWFQEIAVTTGLKLVRCAGSIRRGGTVRHVSIDENVSEPISRRHSPDEALIIATEAARVREEIVRLPRKYQAVISLRVIEGLSTTETARVLRVLPRRASVWIQRGKELLRAQLERAGVPPCTSR